MAQQPEDIAALFGSPAAPPAVTPEDLGSGLTPEEIQLLKRIERHRLKYKEYSPGEYVQQFGSQALRGLAAIPAAVPAVAGAISAGLDPDIDISQFREKTAGGRLATGIEDFAGGIIPPVPGLEESFISDLGGGVGSGAGFVATGGVGAALRVPRLLIPAVAGSFANGIGGLDDAQAHGATPEQQWTAFAVNAGVGTTEALPIGRMFARVNRRSGGVFETIVRAGAANAGEEALQEGLQQLAQDTLAKHMYDEDRAIFDGVMRGASIGGLTGLIFGAGLQANHERSTGAKINRILDEHGKKLPSQKRVALKDQFEDLSADEQKAMDRLQKAENKADEAPVALRATAPKTEGDLELAAWAEARGARVLFAEREDGQPMARARGMADGSTIILDANATPQQRRGVWAHELLHYLKNTSESDWNGLYDWVKKNDPKTLKAAEAAYSKLHSEVFGEEIDPETKKEEGLSHRVEAMGDWLTIYATHPELLETAKPNVLQRLRDSVVGMMRSRLKTSVGLRTTEERRAASVLDALGGGGSADIAQQVGNALDAATSAEAQGERAVEKQVQAAERSIQEAKPGQEVHASQSIADTAIPKSQPLLSEEETLADEATVAELQRKYDTIWASFEQERINDIRAAAEAQASGTTGKIDPDVQSYIDGREYEIAATLADGQRKESEAKARAKTKEKKKSGAKADGKPKQAEKKAEPKKAENKKAEKKKPTRKPVAPEKRGEALKAAAEEVALAKVEAAMKRLAKKLADTEAKIKSAETTKSGATAPSQKKGGDQKPAEQLTSRPANTKAEKYLASLPLQRPTNKAGVRERGRDLLGIYRGMAKREKSRLKERLLSKATTPEERDAAKAKIKEITELRNAARISGTQSIREAAQKRLREMGEDAAPEKMVGGTSPEVVAEFIRARDAADRAGSEYKPGDTLNILRNGRPERFALVFHGSPNFWWQLDPKMMNSGEGTQLEGPGFYVSTTPGATPGYAVNSRRGPLLLLDGERFEPFWISQLDDAVDTDLLDPNDKRRSAGVFRQLLERVDAHLMIEHGKDPEESELFRNGTTTFEKKKDLSLVVDRTVREYQDEIAASPALTKAIGRMVSEIRSAKKVKFVRNVPSTFALDLDIRPDNFIDWSKTPVTGNPEAHARFRRAMERLKAKDMAVGGTNGDYDAIIDGYWNDLTYQALYEDLTHNQFTDAGSERTQDLVAALKEEGIIGHAYGGHTSPNMVIYDPNALKVLWVAPVERFVYREPFNSPERRQGVNPLAKNFLDRAAKGDESLEDPTRSYVWNANDHITPLVPDFDPLDARGRPLTGSARFALAGNNQSWEIDPENLMRRTNRALADRFEGVRNLVKRAGEAQPVLDDENPDLAEQAFPGRVRARMDQLRRARDEVSKTLKDAGLSLEDADKYIYALHAPTRNALMSERRPRKFKYQPGTAAAKGNVPGSGMDDVTAAQIVQDAESSPESDAYKRVARIVRKINKRALEVRVKTGLLPKKVARQWRKDFGKNYIPLLSEPNVDEADTVYGSAATFNTYGPESRVAKGRVSLAASPIAASLSRAEQVVVRSERDRVGKTFAKFARRFPNPQEYQFVKSTKFVPLDSRDQLFRFKENGKEKKIWVKNSTLREALKGLNIDPLPPLIRMLAKGSKFLRLVNTVYSPDFVFTNPIRDIQTGLVNLVGARSADFAKSAATRMKDSRKAMWGVLKDPKGYSGPYAAEAREYLQSGGLSGMESPEALGAVRDSIQRRINESPVLEKIRAVDEWWNRINSSLENTARFASYVEARTRGESRESAVNLAKNLTVNFDRRGQMSGTLGALYLFFNAGLQGSLRTMNALKDRRVMALMGAQVAAGFAMSAYNRAMSDDDDNGVNEWDLFPAWAKERNLVLPGLGNDHVMLPLPLGYNVFWRLGGMIEEARHGHGNLRPVDFASEIVQVAAESFSPIQGGSGIQTIAPSVVDPFIQVLENKDWAGRRIMPESGRRPDVPDSTKVKDAPAPLRAAMAWLNRITGGDEFRSGAVDISPETIEHVYENFTGSLGQTINRSVKLARGALSGDPDPVVASNVAILRRLWAQSNPKAASESFYYENANLAEVERRKQRAGVPSDRRFAGVQQAFDRRIQALRDARRVAESRGDAAAVKRYEDRILSAMQRSNRRLAAIGAPEE